MTAEQFAYWLQGYAELNEAPPTAEQWQAIREHLALVFNKVTPPVWPAPHPGRIAPIDVRPTCTIISTPDPLTRSIC